MPSANPWLAGGNHFATNGIPTAKELPAVPNQKAQNTSVGYDPEKPMNVTGMSKKSISNVKTIRPPYLSVSIPIGIRANEPNKTGTATSTLDSKTDRL